MSLSICNRCCCKCRYIFAVMGFLCFLQAYMSRVDLNVTILSIVNDTEASGKELISFCSTHERKNVSKNSSLDASKHKLYTGETNWDRPTQGLILGAFFWGYIFTQIPGGMLAFKFGPKWIVFTGIFGSSTMEFLIPLSVEFSPYFLIAVRIMQGLLQALITPSLAGLIGQWSPPQEKSRFTAFISSGTVMGTIIGQIIAGWMSQPRLETNLSSDKLVYISKWSDVHYLFGGLGILFSISWIIFVYNNPIEHPWIKSSERNYLLSFNTIISTKNKICKNTQTAIDSTNKLKNINAPQTKAISFDKPSVPWKNIIFSGPVWSILVCHVCFNWAWYTLITSMPTYLYRVLGFNIWENGILSSLPYIVQTFVGMIVASLSDLIIARNILSVTWTRKINNIIALGGLGFGLLAVGLVGCNRLAAVSLFCATVGLMGFSLSGYATNALDIAPPYNGNIISITNTIATLPGIFGPILVGYVTKNSSDVHNWLIIFGIAAGIAWFGALLNLCLTSGQIQKWGILNNPINVS